VRVSCFIMRAAYLPWLSLFFRLRCRHLKYGRWQAGNCCFYGPPGFLALCSKAMEQLSTLDESLYQSLLTQRLRFWYEPQLSAVFDGHYGITEAHLAWKESGVIACVLFSHFEVKFVYSGPVWRRAIADPRVVRQRINAAARAWLREHRMAAELVACFS
jgi:hypothetical protein